MYQGPLNDALGIDPDVYRKVVGRFPTGVTIVTTRLDGIDHAMTVNSFTSVSLDPLLVLFCAEKRARFHDAVIESGIWGVSVLAASMQEASRTFAHRGRALSGRLDGWAHHRGEGEVPLFDQAIATLQCRTSAIHEGGDHSIVVGEVIALGIPTEAAPLVYHEGRYRHF